MGSTANGIRSFSTVQSIKAAILPINSTSEATTTSATMNTPKLMEHNEITNIRNMNDCLLRLGDGDLSDVVTQAMIGAIIIGVVCILAIGYQFSRQMPYILRHTPTKYRTRTLLLCAVYVIVSLAAFVSLVAYQANVFCDSVCHFTFLLCAYQYFVLIIEYVGGESNFIKETHGLLIFDMRTPPLCCCLHCLQPTAITKEKFRALRLMVLQMPIIQGSLLAILNVLNATDTQLHEQVQPFLLIFIVTSILIGVWSLQITSRMIAKHLPEHKIMHKYVAIQLVLILYKLQPTLMHGFCNAIQMMTTYRIGSKCIENAIIQLIILMETVFLSYFANQSYSVPTKAFQPN